MSGDAVHRLGMAVACAAAALSVAIVLVSARSERVARRRLRLLMGAAPRVRRIRGRPGTGLVRDWAAVAGVALGVLALVGGAVGAAAGLGAAWVLRRRQRRPRPAESAEQSRAARQLPLAADLMAACVAAGAGPREAAEAVGPSLGGPLGEALTRAAAELRLGGEPAQCWGRLDRLGCRELARCLERATTTGVPPAWEIARLAAGCRAEHARIGAARARRAGVLITAPLGLCFLPAFLLVGVAPVVMGLAGAILAGTTN
ncbi:type II secretion system F family protein [Actinacidiphila sp. bgisy167]|uniref:type II secretion system F family protein n=1 Tax=Actinacidiphila sp. bgisy167 TaxID=3413797 RepID=UPI003D71D02B